MLASVERQTFGDWEHCLVDDNSDDRHTREILDQAADRDSRIRVQHRSEQGGIAAATNDALRMATGEFVAFLDHDDELAPQALESMAAAIAEHPDVDYLYSDQDKIDEWSKHFDPFVKPGWSPDRLLSQMYVTHFRVIRRSLVEEVGGLRPDFDGSQDWDLALRVVERSQRVVHVPGLLYHWRTLAGSAAGDTEAKPWAYEASRRAVSEHVEAVGIQATVEEMSEYPGHFWLRPDLVDRPQVSIVIPTAGQAPENEVEEPIVLNCVRRLIERTTYDNYELVVVIDERAPETTADRLRSLAGDRLKLVPFDGQFNFSAKVNLGVRESAGEQILLLNDDVEVLPQGWRPPYDEMLGVLPDWEGMEAGGRRRIWIESMLVYAMQPGVGAVGAKLFMPDGRLQHGGVICRRGLAGHPYYLWPGGSPGYGGNLLVACNFLAVTAACLMTPKAVYEEVGGFDEEFPLNYNDVDYCLKLHRSGRRSVLLPHVELLHLESVSRGEEPPAGAEIELLQQRWGELLHNDPYYGDAFISDDFLLPALGRRGQFQERPDLLSHFDRVRRTFRAGGPGLVAERSARRLRYLARRIVHRLRGWWHARRQSDLS